MNLPLLGFGQTLNLSDIQLWELKTQRRTMEEKSIQQNSQQQQALGGMTGGGDPSRMPVNTAGPETGIPKPMALPRPKESETSPSTPEQLSRVATASTANRVRVENNPGAIWNS